VAVLKLFLHISKEEQRRRLLTRLDGPAKRWKFSLGDAERKLWDKYMAAFEDMIRATSQPAYRAARRSPAQARKPAGQDPMSALGALRVGPESSSAQTKLS
jgi:hypothetical protein